MIAINNTTLMDRILIKTLQEKTKLTSLMEQIKISKLKMFKRTKEMSSSITKTCLEGYVEGRRGRGWPKKVVARYKKMDRCRDNAGSNKEHKASKIQDAKETYTADRPIKL